MIPDQFQEVGRDLFSRGLVSSQSGNLSIRLGDSIIITRRGSMLNSLGEQDLIRIGIARNSRLTPLASTELPVHRAIYKDTGAQAIVHAHPPYAVALSLLEHEIAPSPEWLEMMGHVPVIGWGVEVKPGGLAIQIAEALSSHRIVVVRGHGSFAIGQNLKEAFNLTTALEESCQVNWLSRSLGYSSP